MSDLNDKHKAEVYRLGQIIETNARLGGIELRPDDARALVRDVLDNYKPVGLWSEIPELAMGFGPFARTGKWSIWDIRIGARIFSYKMFQHEIYRDDPVYDAHVKRKVRTKMGESISAWIMGEPEPNVPDQRGEGTTTNKVTNSSRKE